MQIDVGNVAELSLTAKFTRELREEILSGRKPPDARLNLAELRDEFGVSLSPIREGLAQLAVEGFVIPVGQRGFRVAPVSAAELQDVTDLRIDLELKGLRRSIELFNENWEVALMRTYRRLHTFETKTWDARKAAEYESLNMDFHRALISGCDSHLLIRFTNVVGRMADRYRRIFLKAHAPDARVPQEHSEIYEAALNKDRDRACEALKRHILRASQNVQKVLLEMGAKNAPMVKRVARRAAG